MEITKRQFGEIIELRIQGRLDGYWADPLAGAIDETIRGGAHHLRLDLSTVTYLSSAGIRVLVQAYKQLRGIGGSLAACNPSEPVLKVLQLAGLTALLIKPASAPDAKAQSLPSTAKTSTRLDLESVGLEVFLHAAQARLQGRLIGDPRLLRGSGFQEDHCQQMPFPDSTFAVGLGALGSDFADARGRFGEFLAVAGAVAYLPTDCTNVPDYLVATEGSVLDMQVCYCIACEGTFSHLARFEAKGEAGVVPLTELVEACLHVAQDDAIGLVLVAETTGLMGAALRQSPAAPGSGTTSLFGFPQVREWLTFTAERAFPRSVALVVGVATRGSDGPLAPLVRPLGRKPGLAGHFHAAAFSYRPLPRGNLELKPTVATLFETQTLQGVLHLLSDDREIAGAGESEFVRGACWFAPLAERS
jgi:anti-anti-sigma factor